MPPFGDSLFDHGGAIGDRRRVRGRFWRERNLAKKKVWGTFGNLGRPLEHQGEGSLITKRKRIQKPRSRVQVQVQVEDPKSRVQDETWSRPALKRGGGYIYICIYIDSY